MRWSFHYHIELGFEFESKEFADVVLFWLQERFRV